MIRQRADGRWKARLSLGHVDGRRARKSVFGRTQREVREKLTVLQRERDQGLARRTDERETMAAFLEQWLDQVRPSLRPRTWQGYALIVRRQLVPAIGRIPVARLTPADIQQALNRRQAAGASAQTVRNEHAVLRRALGQAVRWGIAPRNVATLVTLPRVDRPEVQAIAPADARAILEAVRGDRIEALVTLALATGLRQGEALALRWSDVDLDDGRLTVRHSLQRVGAGAELVEPKTRRSRRTIALPRGIVASLREHRTRQLQARLWAGSAWQEGGYVFTTSIGTPMHAGDVTKRLQALLAAAGLPRMRFHDLRHGAASLLLAQGVAPRVVMEVLGHSTIALTMNVYSHVIPALERDAADRMDAILSAGDAR
jgi:integrase